MHHLEIAVEEVDLLLDLVDLLGMLGLDMLPHKVRALELLATEGTQPLVLGTRGSAESVQQTTLNVSGLQATSTPTVRGMVALVGHGLTSRCDGT